MFYHILKTSSLLCLLLSISSEALSAGTAGPTHTGVLTNPGMSLVRAEVIEANEDKGIQRCRLKITAILCGDSAKKGAVFIASSTATPESSTGSDIYPPPKKGEEGLWLIRLGEDGGYRVLVQYRWGVHWPARKGITSRYEETVALAKALKDIEKTSPAQREELLLKYAGDMIPEVASAAVEIVAQCYAKRVKAIMQKLLEKVKLASTLMSIDSVLVTVDARWKDSKKRAAMFSNVVAEKMTQYQAIRVRNRISASWQDQTSSSTDALQWLTQMSRNESIPRKERQGALRLIGWIAFQSKRAKREDWEDVSEKAVRILTDAIAQQKHEELRLAAAYALGSIPLTKASRDRIKALLASEGLTPEVKKPIMRILQKPVNNRR